MSEDCVKRAAIDLGSIRLAIDYEHDILMLYRPNGEGMEIGKKELEKLLDEYYKGNF